MIGGQTKTPTMSVLFERKADYRRRRRRSSPSICGAAGAEVVFSTVLGNDDLEDFVLEDLKGKPASTASAVDRPVARRPSTRTPSWSAAIGCSRSTRSTTARSPTRSCSEMTKAVATTPTDAVVYSDFRHGIFNRRTIPELIRALPPQGVQGRRQPGRQPLGQHHRFPGLRPDHAERARGALRARRPGFRHPAAGLRALRRGRLQAPDPEARRARRAGLPRRRSRIARQLLRHRQLRRAIWSIAVGAGDALLAYSTLRMLVNGNDAIATHPRHDGRGLRMRSRRQHCRSRRTTCIARSIRSRRQVNFE